MSKKMNSGGFASLMREQMMELVNKPAGKRPQSLMDSLVNWMKIKFEVFQKIQKDVVIDILQNCSHEICHKDDVMIEQGELGDCFFVLLGGSVDIYVNTTPGEKDESQLGRQPTNIGERKQAVDLAQYGTNVATCRAGSSFGELALINADCIRNATVIAQDKCFSLVVSRELYNRCLRQAHEDDLRERMEFVETSQYFRQWQQRFRKQLAFSLRRKYYSFEERIVKQGGSIDGLEFLMKGEAEVQIDPTQHTTQYPILLRDVIEEEPAKQKEPLRLRRSRTAITRSTEEKDDQELYRPQTRSIIVSLVGRGEVIGDLEMCMELPSYAETYLSRGTSTTFFLDSRHYERLVAKKNPWTVDTMRVTVESKIRHRMLRVEEWRALPLYHVLLLRAMEQNDQRQLAKERQMIEASGGVFRPPMPSKAENRTASALFREHKGPLIDQFGPGSVFYRNRERQRKREEGQRLRDQFRDDFVQEPAAIH